MAARARLARRGCAATLVLLVLTYLAVAHVRVVARLDERVYLGFGGLRSRPHVSSIATVIAHLCDPFPYVLLAAVPLLVAIVRRRPRVALVAAVILVGANETTEILKPLLNVTRPGPSLAQYGLTPGTWPSGHATAAMALALVCVLVVPARLRPSVASLGAAFSVAVSYSFLALGWHLPSDALGGFLVAMAWALAAVGVLFTLEARGRARPAVDDAPDRLSVGAALAPQLAALAGVAALACLVAISRPHTVLGYARGHPVFLAGAAAIGVLALTLPGLLTLGVRR